MLNVEPRKTRSCVIFSFKTERNNSVVHRVVHPCSCAVLRYDFPKYSIDAVQWCVARTGCTRFAYIHADSKTNQSCVPSGHRIGTPMCSPMRPVHRAILRNALSDSLELWCPRLQLSAYAPALNPLLAIRSEIAGAWPSLSTSVNDSPELCRCWRVLNYEEFEGWATIGRKLKLM